MGDTPLTTLLIAVLRASLDAPMPEGDPDALAKAMRDLVEAGLISAKDGVITDAGLAAFNRQMHEDGCPEGEAIRAGLEAAIAAAVQVERERCLKAILDLVEDFKSPSYAGGGRMAAFDEIFACNECIKAIMKGPSNE